MFSQELQQLGLSAEEAKVYETLLNRKPLSVAELAKKTPYKKGNLYNILRDLEEAKLISKKVNGKTSLFEAAHPSTIAQLLEEKDKELQKAKNVLEAAMPQMLSAYNLNHAKPGVRFFEGEQGLKKAYDNLLQLGEEILSISDDGKVRSFYSETYLKSFVRRRVSKKIKTKVVAPTTNKFNKSSKKDLRERRTISSKNYPFTFEINIAGSSVHITTLEKASPVAIVIHDPIIAANFKLIFQFMWDQAKPETSNS